MNSEIKRIEDESEGTFEPLVTDELLDGIKAIYNDLRQLKELETESEKLKGEVLSVLRQIFETFSINTKIKKEFFTDIFGKTISGISQVNLNSRGILVIRSKDNATAMALKDMPVPRVIAVLKAVIMDVQKVADTKRENFEEYVNALHSLKSALGE